MKGKEEEAVKRGQKEDEGSREAGQRNGPQKGVSEREEEEALKREVKVGQRKGPRKG